MAIAGGEDITDLQLARASLDRMLNAFDLAAIGVVEMNGGRCHRRVVMKFRCMLRNIFYLSVIIP